MQIKLFFVQIIVYNRHIALICMYDNIMYVYITLYNMQAIKYNMQ